MKTSVVLIGCGNIGFRHLQALAPKHEIQTFYVIEPNSERLSACLRDIGGLDSERFVPLKSLDDLKLQPDAAVKLVVSAVTADVQLQIAAKIAALPGAAFLLEKPAAQHAEGLASVQRAFAKVDSEKVYVNCPRALWSGYQDLREVIESDNVKLRIDITGNQWGFGCNAVHFLELFRFLVGGSAVRCLDSQLQNSALGSKRGPAFEEFYGTASFTDGGHYLQLTSGSAGDDFKGVVVVGRNADTGAPLWMVDEVNETIVRFGGATGGGTKTSKLHPLLVSKSTGVAWDVINLGRASALPTLKTAHSSHLALYEALEKATGRNKFKIS